MLPALPTQYFGIGEEIVGDDQRFATLADPHHGDLRLRGHPMIWLGVKRPELARIPLTSAAL